MFAGKRAAVEQQGMPSASHPGYERVHDSAGNACVAVFHPLRQVYRIDGVDSQAEQLVEAVDGCRGERRRRTQSGSDGHIALDEHLEPAGQQVSQFVDCSGYIGAPGPRTGFGAFGKRVRDPLVELRGVQDHRIVSARPQRRVCTPVDRHRQHESLVVIRVIPDQIDAPRGTHDKNIVCIRLAESGPE